MILRIDRIQTELPPPSDPDPAGAAVVQELMGGKFGEMSTFMNYTFQSFNFRLRQGARPFYDLVANIAAEEFGHIELVAATINTMLTGAGEKGSLPKPADLLNPQQIIAGGAAALCQDSNGKPWNGDYITSTGDLVEDLVHNFFLETGARNNKLKVYEMCDHPAARALTGYLLVRGGVVDGSGDEVSADAPVSMVLIVVATSSTWPNSSAAMLATRSKNGRAPWRWRKLKDWNV